jgi:hypothetical protein
VAPEGFDIGLHGSYRAALEPGLLAEERAALEDATGLALATTRQHFLRWDVRSTPGLQVDAGFRADSTLGFNRNVGFRAGTSLPFRVFDVASGRTLPLLEVPLVVQDSALLGRRALALDLAGAQRVVRGIFDVVARVGGALTLLFHPDKLVRREWLSLFEWTLDEALERRAWVTSLAGMEAWWSRRERRILGG